MKGLPNSSGVVVDDNEVVALLLSLGYTANRFHKATLTDNFAALVSNRHPTHWILFVRFFGFENPADNGFTATYWPRAAHTPEQALEKVREAMAEYGADPSAVIEFDE